MISWGWALLGGEGVLLWRGSFYFLLISFLCFSIGSLYYIFSHKEKEPLYWDKAKVRKRDMREENVD